MPAPSNAREVVAAARDGRGDALAELYARYGRSLMALAYRLTGSRADAEDVLHDVFLGLPEALRRYDERGSLDAWLRRVTARVAITRLRKRSRSREVALADDLVAPVTTAADWLGDVAIVERAINTLPDSLRAVFVLREVEGYSHAEIAELLDISTNASEVRLHRATRALRRQLGAGSDALQISSSSKSAPPRARFPRRSLRPI
jgi:RNA polymerase sigma-70 factor (ECF subfamily)